MAAECCLSVSPPYLKSYLTCRKILQHGADGFTSRPKKVMLRIFIALKNTSLSAGFEPLYPGSNGKHDNLYTTNDDDDDDYEPHTQQQKCVSIYWQLALNRSQHLLVG
jgi:hypothetical protein